MRLPLLPQLPPHMQSFAVQSWGLAQKRFRRHNTICCIFAVLLIKICNHDLGLGCSCHICAVASVCTARVYFLEEKSMRHVLQMALALHSAVLPAAAEAGGGWNTAAEEQAAHSLCPTQQ